MMSWNHSSTIMLAHYAGIRVCPAGLWPQDANGRDKPGHDSKIVVR